MRRTYRNNEMPLLKYVFTSVVLILAAASIGCDSNDNSVIDDDIAEIRILPDSVAVQPEDEIDFSVVALREDGEPAQDVEADVRWWSTDSTVFTVNNEGNAVTRGTGKAYCMVEVTTLSKAPLFVGRDSAVVMVF